MADFIEYTDEIFPGVKHLKGVCVEGKELYYLSDSHALYDYVQKFRNGFDVNFTPENMDMFINKANYFLYPDKRLKSCNADLKGKDKGKDKDISVEDFSFYCVNMFYKRFGIEFDFLRITSDKTDAAFVEGQKCCLVDLFRQCLYWLQIGKKIHKNMWDKLLRMFYRDLRFQLSKIDITYLMLTYNPFLKSELREYALCSNRAFHQLKNLYTHTNYVVGNDALVDRMNKAAIEQFKKAEDTVRLIYSLVFAENKQDINEVVENLCSQNPPPIRLTACEPHIYPVEFKKFYSKLDDKNATWKAELINAWMSCNLIGIYESSDASALTYAMYKEEYQLFYDKYKSLCAKILQIKKEKKEAYWNVLTEKVLHFESMLHNTAFCLFLQLCSCETEDDEE